MKHLLKFTCPHGEQNQKSTDLFPLPESRRRHAAFPAEYGGEIIAVGEPAFERDLANGKSGMQPEQDLGLSIGEIAFKCGSADSNYFSAVFRRKRGMTPTQCRRSPQH